MSSMEGDMPHFSHAIAMVGSERIRQDELWGEQDHPYVITEEIPAIASFGKVVEDDARRYLDESCKQPTWVMILLEEVGELLQVLDDDERMLEELVQVVAVGVHWIECILAHRADDRS